MKKCATMLLLAPVVCLAEGWKGEGELGYSLASGNTESESLVAKLGIKKIHEQWEHAANIETHKASTDSVTSADSFVFREKSQYNFAEKVYAYEKLRYEDDKFSGYDYQSSLVVGAGSRVIQNETHTLDLAAGIGYGRSKLTANGETNGQGLLSADANYQYQISETATFSEKLSVESSEDNTHSESETVLKTKINSSLSSKITYLVKHNSEVPVGIEKTDKLLTVTLSYDF